jgi:hypothetical protein
MTNDQRAKKEIEKRETRNRRPVSFGSRFVSRSHQWWADGHQPASNFTSLKSTCKQIKATAHSFFGWVLAISEFSAQVLEPPPFQKLPKTRCIR